MSRVGMDIDQVRSIATALDTQAVQLASTIDGIDATLRTAQQTWRGPDAETFTGHWQHQLRPSMERVRQLLAEMTRLCRSNADEQDLASGSSIAGWSVPSSGVAAGIAVTVVAGVARFFGGGSDGAGPSPTGYSAGASVSGSFAHGGLSGEGSASVRAGAWAEGDAHAGFSDGAYEAGVNGSIRAGVEAAAAGSLAYGIASASGHARAFAGAEAEGSADFHAGLDGIRASAGARAFAGVEANASGSADIGGVGVTGSAGVTAGIGAEAHVEGSISATEIKVQADLGATLGIGFHAKVGFEVNPEEVATNIADGVSKFFGH